MSLLGMIAFCSQGAVFFVTPFAGLLSGHRDKRRLIAVMHCIMLGQAIVLTMLTWFELIKPWHLLLLAFVSGIASAIDASLRRTTQMSLIPEKSHLQNAIALNSLLVNVARVAGPVVAGLVIAAFNEAICFALNALSSVAVIITLWRIDWHDSRLAVDSNNYWYSFMEGGRYALQIPPIRSGFVLVCAVSWCIAPYMALMPAFASDVLNGDAKLLGNLLGASGAGTVAGTVYLAARRSTNGLCSVIAIAAGLSGIAMCMFAMAATYLSASLALCLVGSGMTVVAAGSNTIFQSLAPVEMRDRITSIYIMAFIGVAPFGSLASAVIADQTGIRPALLLNGAACCLAALWFKSKSTSKSALYCNDLVTGDGEVVPASSVERM
jgi:MFS family permease